jgi:hypothetical protein
MKESRTQFDPAYVVSTSAALVKALGEAQALVDTGDFSERLRTLIAQARELLVCLRGQLATKAGSEQEFSKGLAESMANHLETLEHLVATHERPPRIQ